VGETEEERERGDTERKLRHQVQEGLEKVPVDRLPEVVVAYEPIWAIGSGRSATPEQAQEAVAFVRALVEGIDKAAGQAVRILYGGSLKPENAEELLALPDVDGALVGGAASSRTRSRRSSRSPAGGRDSVKTVSGVCLVILDGWGLAPDGPGNAVSLADTPVFDGLWEQYDHTQLTACGEAVGLPRGRWATPRSATSTSARAPIVPQDLLRIDKAVEDGSLAENEVILAALRDAPRVHFIGLVSDGGVHSSDRHLKALIELAARRASRTSSARLHRRPRHLAHGGADFLATVQGVDGRGGAAGGSARRRPLLRDGPRHALGPHREGRQAPHGGRGRARGLSPARRPRRRPTSATRPTSSSPHEGRRRRGRRSAPGDSVFAFNFRPDRMRQITEALTKAGVDRYATLTEYEEGWPYPVAFTPARPDVTLARVISERGETQLHVSETEKYPHVTYFFNGGEEEPYDGRGARARRLPARRADVRQEARDERARVLRRVHPALGGGLPGVRDHQLRQRRHGRPHRRHRGGGEGIETVDECLGRVVEAVHGTGGACIIVADHGNADEMLEEDGSPDTAHSLNPVPFIVTLDA
jgi:2,3-bisphosphoglycerate-independent phosphoglycerate mutase